MSVMHKVAVIREEIHATEGSSLLSSAFIALFLFVICHYACDNNPIYQCDEEMATYYCNISVRVVRCIINMLSYHGATSAASLDIYCTLTD